MSDNNAASMYFYSNTCHVCKIYGEKVNLKRCGGCKTIAYCSKKHQSKHWPYHKDLCKLLTEIVKHAGTIFGMRERREQSIESWTRAKTNLMLLVQMKLRRKLETYETEMFKFPRACIVCHETDSRKLVDCFDCPATSFCHEHQFNNDHSAKCRTMKLCFGIETAQSHISLENHEIIGSFRNKNIPNSMQDIVDLSVSQKNGNLMLTNNSAAWASEYLTRPLTFLYTLKHLNSPNLAYANIHVIGANAIETESLVYWETLLHLKESIIEITLVLVGPELCQQNYQMKLCDDCSSRNKKIQIITVDKLYCDYTASKDFLEPDFIIGFNLGIHECEDIESTNDTWASSIKVIAKRDCPFAMTSYTAQESHDERKRIRDLLNDNFDLLHCGQNPFASLRPYRDFESEDFFYQNNYITIYKKFF